MAAARKGSREAEIEMYRHPLPTHKVHQSKKQYNRAKIKAGQDKDRSFLLIGGVGLRFKIERQLITSRMLQIEGVTHG